MKYLTPDEVIVFLTEAHEPSQEILKQIYSTYPDKFSTLCLDIADMQMRGADIAIAYNASGASIEKFIANCASRDGTMIDQVLGWHPESEIRKHGPQSTAPRLDTAIAEELKKAKEENRLRMLDEGAEYVHNFWLTVLNEMQLSGQFQINQKVNLGGNGWAIFHVSLAELLNPDGTPFKKEEMLNAERNHVDDSDAQTSADHEPQTGCTAEPGRSEVGTAGDASGSQSGDG